MKVRTRWARRVAGGLLAAAAAASVLAGLAGCLASSAMRGEGGKLSVVAAENVWGSIAQQLGGEKARVVSLVANPNADPHDYEPTVADAKVVARANVVVANGAGYDAWMAQLIAASPARARANVNVSEGVGVAAGENPHVWYSPRGVHAVIDAITRAYKRVDPADAAYFDARRAMYLRELGAYDALVAQIASDYAGVPVGASESIVEPLARELKLSLVTPPGFLSAIGEGVDPSLADKAEVDAQIRERRIKVFIYNRQNSTPDVMALVAEARAAGIPVVTVTETIAPAGTTFQAWQTRQLTELAQALRKSTGR